MSYVAKKGKAAAESATQEKQDFSKALYSFKSGTALKVRIPSDEDYVEYFCHSVYKKFYSTPCTKPSGRPDLYDKAVDLLYQDADQAKQAGDEKKAEELRDLAYQLKAKPRYLFGFINLSDGEQIVVDASKAQAQVFIKTIEKFAKKIEKVAFELSKEGSGTSTTVSLTPVLDMDEDLTDKERANFDKTAGKAFNDDLYENVLYVKDQPDQIEDLKSFGFDVSRLGIVDNEVTPIEDDEDPAVKF